jgi:hypothetical protein
MIGWCANENLSFPKTQISAVDHDTGPASRREIVLAGRFSILYQVSCSYKGEIRMNPYLPIGGWDLQLAGLPVALLEGRDRRQKPQSPDQIELLGVSG